VGAASAAYIGKSAPKSATAAKSERAFNRVPPRERSRSGSIGCGALMSKGLEAKPPERAIGA
jgi:hypothetical protein